MKCDELKVETIVPQGCALTLQMYPKAEVDAAIAELKARIQLDDDEMAGFLDLEEECGGGDLRNYIAELKADNERLKYEKRKMYTKMQHDTIVDALCREHRQQLRSTRRALFRAIAIFCARSCEYFNGIMSHCLIGQDDLYKRCEEKKNKYLNAMYKCRAKAEEYK